MDYQYSRDAVGNVTAIAGKKLPPAPPPEPGAALDYLYGSNRLDRLTAATTRQYQYDNNGNTISDGVRTFVYNQDNRLVRVLQDQAVLADYAYDGFGRRVKKTTAQGVTVYHYDLHDRLLAESKGDGTPLRDYIYLEDELVAFREYGAQAGYYYVMNDHLATPQFVTDQTGATVWEAAYGPYGEAVVEVATVEFNLRFPGQYYDAETGLHYNWHRYYDPETGRYLTPDPIGLEGGDVNLYSYVWQNPVNYIDPTGEFGLLGAGIGFAMDLGLQLAMNGGRLECVDWADVALSTAFGAIAPGALGSAKKGLKLGKLAFGSHKRLKQAKRAKYIRRLTQKINTRLGSIGHEVAMQGAWQGSKFALKKALNYPAEDGCSEKDLCEK